VAIPAISSKLMHLAAAVGEKVYTLNKDGVTLEAGKYYACTAKLKETQVVTNEAELCSALTAGWTTIVLGANITLLNLLEIKDNRTVTINMGGYKLDRGCTSRGSQVIVVRTGSTLNLNNGTVTGGWGGNGGALDIETGTVVNLTDVVITGNHADDRGGGISNKGTLTMTGGSITNNTSNDHSEPVGGGGLFNYEGATATLNGVTITGNTAHTHGGGIWNAANATLKMQGAITVTGNTANEGVVENVYLNGGGVINVTGSLAGSQIGISMQTPGIFTEGYKLHNDANPATLFSSDLDPYLQVSASGDEVCLAQQTEGSVYYIERSWDGEKKCVKAQIKTLESGNYTVLEATSGDIELQPNVFYVVRENNVHYGLIHAVGGENHRLILCDGAKLDANFIEVENSTEDGNNALHIYGQANDSGQLLVEVVSIEKGSYAGIGGGYERSAGTVVIHGGDIRAEGHEGAAGIGGGKGGNGGIVTIYGGSVYARGNGRELYGAAGIGGGNRGDGGMITIYGGAIEAHGSLENGGAGIGGGNCGDNEERHSGGTITIHGGDVKAYGGYRAAGIGGGLNGNGATVTINGGEVYAKGSDGGAGIGTGYNGSSWAMSPGSLTVTGGTVYAYGSQGGEFLYLDGGAGIGGGCDASGGEVSISGGYVRAEGGWYAAGIGSGVEKASSEGRHGGSLNVTGGEVYAYGGIDGAGIGGGEDADGANVVISGGYVYAEGNDNAAGIGGGEDANGGPVQISGGTVIAKAGKTGNGFRAIGAGPGGTDSRSLTLGDLLMVRPAFGEGWFAPLFANQRVDGCRNNAGVWIQVCYHPEHTAENCPYCVH